MSTEQLHWFRKPGTNSPNDKGTFNPVFELLDYPIVAGQADEVFFADAEVSLTYEDALDRVAKFAGILRAVHEPAPPFVVIDDGLRPVTLILAMLAALRLGSCVVLGAKGLKPGEKKTAPVLRPIDGAPAEAGEHISSNGDAAAQTAAKAGMHTETRKIWSHFEGTELLADGPESKPLDAGALMKESAFKHAAAAEIGPGREVLRLDGVSLSAAESLNAVEMFLSR